MGKTTYQAVKERELEQVEESDSDEGSEQRGQENPEADESALSPDVHQVVKGDSDSPDSDKKKKKKNKNAKSSKNCKKGSKNVQEPEHCCCFSSFGNDLFTTRAQKMYPCLSPPTAELMLYTCTCGKELKRMIERSQSNADQTHGTHGTGTGKGKGKEVLPDKKKGEDSGKTKSGKPKKDEGEKDTSKEGKKDIPSITTDKKDTGIASHPPASESATESKPKHKRTLSHTLSCKDDVGEESSEIASVDDHEIPGTSNELESLDAVETVTSAKCGLCGLGNRSKLDAVLDSLEREEGQVQGSLDQIDHGKRSDDAKRSDIDPSRSFTHFEQGWTKKDRAGKKRISVEMSESRSSLPSATPHTPSVIRGPSSAREMITATSSTPQIQLSHVSAAVESGAMNDSSFDDDASDVRVKHSIDDTIGQGKSRKGWKWSSFSLRPKPKKVQEPDSSVLSHSVGSIPVPISSSEKSIRGSSSSKSSGTSKILPPISPAIHPEVGKVIFRRFEKDEEEEEEEDSAVVSISDDQGEGIDGTKEKVDAVKFSMCCGKSSFMDDMPAELSE
ncbi:hypothetical protein ADUPG1_008969 [Aduncisulcus paluster]|uniref:Uncharacterized protein n=1 Tax=Aduncisulcus paluster TaxID=2918883 RepID=A0ABQ5KXX8_9EUKA|nr:hypothetical protein ADUPG1_008969 [Aduncisulcus paluster]